MTADYYTIRKHPAGGYAVILGETYISPLNEVFPSIMKAMWYALKWKPEGGVRIHPECDGYVTVPS